MKYVSIFFVFFTIGNFGFSQGNLKNFPIGVVIPKQAELKNDSVEKLLEDKLQQALASQGLGGKVDNYNFVLYPVVNLVTTEVTSTAPTMYIQNMDVSFYISDFQNTTTFSTTSINLKGVGRSVQKALINGFKNINPRNSDLIDMIKEGKLEIQNYYSEKCELLVIEAESKAHRGQYLDAISDLLAFPMVAEKCFLKSREIMNYVYDELEKQACRSSLMKAKLAFANSDYNLTVEYLNRIPPTVDCIEDVDGLILDLKTKQNEIDKRNWNFLMKIHEDKVDIEKHKIKSIEAMASAYMMGLALSRKDDAAKIIINKIDLD